MYSCLDRDNVPDLSSFSVQPICDEIEDEWPPNTFGTFHDLMADADFGGGVDFDSLDEFPRLEFDLLSIPQHRDKMDDLLQFSNPEIPRDLLRSALSSRPMSPFAAPLSPLPQMSVALPKPPIPTWNGVSNDVPCQRPSTRCIQQLSKLSMSLYEHSTQLPPLSITILTSPTN